ncbi:MAG: hypothetical protein COA82_12905 [Alkaliphilus sp.]|nr:MAG: hypothetical protein COA82_12905 [Alkaliphilus sp.]
MSLGNIELWTDVAIAITFLLRFAVPFSVTIHYKSIYNLKYKVKSGYFYWILLGAPVTLLPIYLQFTHPGYPVVGTFSLIVVILAVAQVFERLYIFKEGIIINGVYYYWEEIEGYKFANRKLTIKARQRKWNSIIRRKHSWEVEKSKNKAVVEAFKEHLQVIEM